MEIPVINTRQLTRSSLAVQIHHVASPTYFWVHLENSRVQFEEMLEELQLRMQRRGNFLICWPNRVKANDIYAVKLDDGTWQRGIVTTILGNGSVTVALRDWGTNMFRKVHHLFTLEDRFRDVPWQAIPCALAHTAPSDHAPVWPKEACILTKLACEGKQGWMRIKGTAREEAAFIDLRVRMQNEGEVMHVRSLLKDFGYARDVPEVKSGAQPSI